jgi:hypothetical protein
MDWVFEFGKMTILASIDGEKPRPTERADRSRRCAGAPAADPTFDRWLTHHLCQLYDPVVQEPLPGELVRLLEERLR